MNKKLLFIGIGVVIVALVAIGYFTTRPKKYVPPAPVNFVTFEKDEALEQLVQQYAQKYQTQVNFTYLDKENYEAESLNLIATGKADLWLLPHSWIPKHQNKLDAYTKAEFSTSSLVSNYAKAYPKVIYSENVINNRIIGYPLTIDPLVMFVNNSVLKESLDGEKDRQIQDLVKDEVETWDQLKEKAKYITKTKNGQVTVAATNLGSINSDAATDLLTVLMLQEGTQILDKDKSRATIHTATNLLGKEAFPGARALDFYAGFGKKTAENFSYDDGFSEPLREFLNAKIAYYFDYASAKEKLELINPGNNINFSRIPQMKESAKSIYLIDYDSITVPLSSTKRSSAWKLVEYLTSEKVFENYIENSGKIPAFGEEFEKDSTVNYLKDADYWYNPDGLASDKIFREAIKQTISGVSAQTVLDGVSLQINALINKLQR